MIRLYRRNKGEDVLLSVSDGIDAATVHLSKTDLEGLFGAVVRFRRLSESALIEFETTGEVLTDNSSSQREEEG